MYNQQTIGTCSICGGAVTVPSVWLGILPPTPTCSRCGAHAAQNFGPVIPMVPIQPWRDSTALPWWTNPPTTTSPWPTADRNIWWFTSTSSTAGSTDQANLHV